MPPDSASCTHKQLHSGAVDFQFLERKPRQHLLWCNRSVTLLIALDPNIPWTQCCCLNCGCSLRSYPDGQTCVLLSVAITHAVHRMTTANMTRCRNHKQHALQESCDESGPKSSCNMPGLHSSRTIQGILICPALLGPRCFCLCLHTTGLCCCPCACYISLT